MSADGRISGTACVAFQGGGPVANAAVTVTLSSAASGPVFPERKAARFANASGCFSFTMIASISPPIAHTVHAHADWSGNQGDGDAPVGVELLA